MTDRDGRTQTGNMPVSRPRAGISLWGISRTKRKIVYLRDVTPIGSPPRHYIQWIHCVDCHRWATVESHVTVVPDAPWTCKENIWNPDTAFCFTRDNFVSAYEEWWKDTIGASPAVLCYTICGVKMDFWYIYGAVTQLGGWSTVSANNWMCHVLSGCPESSHAEARLSVLYLRYLYDFECVHFHGKRYDTPSEGLTLWSPTTGSRKRKRVDVDPATHKQMVVSDGSSCYVNCQFKAT